MGIDGAVFREADACGESERIFSFTTTNPRCAHDAFQGADFFVFIDDRKGFVEINRTSVLTEYFYAKAVERAEGHRISRFGGSHLGDTLLHFACGFIGEGNRQDFRRSAPFLLYQPRDPFGEDTGFSASGAG